MPIWLRKPIAVLTFGMFFTSGILLGTIFVPLMRLLIWNGERRRAAVTRFLQFLYPIFCWWMRFAGLIDYRRFEYPKDWPVDGPYMLLANHPTLIDTLFMLAWLPRLTSVVKGSWYDRLVLRWLMRSTNYIPGPGYEGDEDRETPVFDRMVAHMRAGFPLLVFPEGTRAPPDEMLRFRRGTFEAAIAAKVPILPVFIGVDNPGLTKGIPLVEKRMTYTFEPMPWTDTRTGDHDARELCARYAEMYQQRHRRYLADRDAKRLASGERERAESAS